MFMVSIGWKSVFLGEWATWKYPGHMRLPPESNHILEGMLCGMCGKEWNLIFQMISVTSGRKGQEVGSVAFSVASGT